ncbi:SGNH/GDSL hydrolase family protein [Wenyingzhuangia sp. 2_MG-2023]|uniref:SGNH/GDSL hydrolase family protein n=1 Tax=Wenyingzhuangia sp. 2_MG-2023 TaxID=3062639 RepID=UPI0026E46709|nr:SGNH/GDSL hydrolase family protein [Wenyingzhuangia sp. 2_MG-2023]MDO6737744.1 SGNH/GDSL hydrolase family protein [Wenyingzhuangia sp. 2_MG-2023]
MNRRESFKLLGALGLVSLIPVKTLGAILQSGGEICKEAWASLGKFTRIRYQFRYIEPIANLPKVFIYGDSVSIGYTEYVRVSLKNKACVYRLHTNGQSSDYFIPRMEALRKKMFEPFLKGGWDFEWDVIHFNVGLHDLKYLAGNKLDKEKGTQVSTLEVYEENLHKIINYLNTTYPKAKLIFATTTPVPEGADGRFSGDSIKYNEVALKVMKQYPEVVVNDLGTFSIPVLKAHGVKKGDVHYNAEGSRLQGIQVAEKIANAIGVTPVECPSAATIQAQFKEYESKIKNKRK